MKFIYSSGCLYTLPLLKSFEIARKVGFSGAEVVINYHFAFSAGRELLSEARQLLPITALHAPFFDIDGWGNNIQQLEKTVDLAIAYDIPLVNFHPPAWLTPRRQFWRWMNKVSDFQREVGREQVLITIENMPADGPWGCHPHFLNCRSEMIEFMTRRNLHLTFDTAHMGSYSSDILTDFREFHDTGQVKNIHFSDFSDGKEHLPPGQGELPLTQFLNQLRDLGYNEALTLELTPFVLPREEEPICATLRDILAYLRRETGYEIQAAS